MWSFLFGLTAGSVVFSTVPQVRRGVEALLVNGENAVHTAHRVAVQAHEDFEDLVAEANASYMHRRTYKISPNFDQQR